MARISLVLLLAPLLVGALPSGRKHAPAMDERAREISKSRAAVMAKEVVASGSLSCVACSMVVQGLQALIKEDAPEKTIDDFLVKACNALNIEQPHVCDHIIDAFANEAYFVIERTLLTPTEICGIFLDNCGTPVNPLFVMWNLTIPGNKPAVKPWPVVTAPKKTMRVLHLSDIHIDRQYAEGSEAECQDDNWLNTYALCCRDYLPTASANATAPNKIKVPAGKWGSAYNCDIPYRTFDHAMKHISQTHKDIDYIIITGDLEAHDSWDYTKDLTRANIENVTQALLNYFPGVKIYESVGNHEGVPQDAMAPHTMDEYDTRGPQWLYSALAKSWSNWISPAAVNDVQYRASYAVYPAPGLKLISLNTVYCSSFNFYLYIDQRDPDGTLEWLIDHLLESESKGEKVHIISHIPAGDNYCLKGWAHNFYEIVNRFENTIAGQFYGHTHNDHFQVYYENSDPAGRPTHFNFISPSLTTYDFNNPAYRIYTIDGGYEGASYTALEAETYTANLENANKNGGEPEYFLEYNTRELYGMPDLSPASWHAVINRLETDDALFKTFHEYYYRAPHSPNCYKSPECRKKMVCHMRVAKSFEEDHFCGAQ